MSHRYMVGMLIAEPYAKLAVHEYMCNVQHFVFNKA
jgi:hypothetical protein